MTDEAISRTLKSLIALRYRQNNRETVRTYQRIYMRNYRARNAAYRRANRLRRVERYHQNSEYRKAA